MGQPSENFAAARTCCASRFATLQLEHEYECQLIPFLFLRPKSGCYLFSAGDWFNWGPKLFCGWFSKVNSLVLESHSLEGTLVSENILVDKSLRHFPSHHNIYVVHFETLANILGGPFLRACFFLRFEVQKESLLYHIDLLQFHSLEALEACLEACSDVFCSNFHGLATLEFKTCIEACLQLCFTYNFWFAAISITLKPRGLPWGRPFAPAAA